jgi:hypothetical protein
MDIKVSQFSGRVFPADRPDPETGQHGGGAANQGRTKQSAMPKHRGLFFMAAPE